jgi:DNA-binding transcriptional MerR regulator
MPYSVQQLAELAGVSVRTLHHYDTVGLLRPARQAKNGYRQYGEEELLKLQQILFFRELEFPLEDIKQILHDPKFNMRVALHEQRELIELKKKRLSKLLKTIDQTLKKLNQETTMQDKDLYVGLSKEEEEKYAAEAKERWGHTNAYKQSQERYGKLSDAEKQKIGQAGQDLVKNIANHMVDGPKSDVVQKLIAQHYEALRVFYDPNTQMYRGLAEMYVTDPRFAAFYEKFTPGLAQFMRDAMVEFCDRTESKA